MWQGTGTVPGQKSVIKMEADNIHVLKSYFISFVSLMKCTLSFLLISVFTVALKRISDKHFWHYFVKCNGTSVNKHHWARLLSLVKDAIIYLCLQVVIYNGRYQIFSTYKSVRCFKVSEAIWNAWIQWKQCLKQST
jgi:hypothetical protein